MLGLVSQSDLNEDSNEFIYARWLNMVPMMHFLRREQSPRVTGVNYCSSIELGLSVFFKTIVFLEYQYAHLFAFF